MRGAALLALAAALPGPALADWSCRIEAFCRVDDACRPLAEPIPVAIRETTENWILQSGTNPPDLLRALTPRGALPFLAVSLEGGETVTALAIAPDGAWHATTLDLSLGETLALTARGTCQPD
ncbi:MAG TPA: hypothetical protein PKD10_12550 [Paracoccaceae bacterium]|nr:hypothetical protein [Paracoccaceae bacterium]HMO70259.1 hypothetical protein [Paracoccaceae bacterium]